MGKSFANFMCKKFFHPSSFANIKRVWLAEQRVAEETKKQDELRAEYERDQDHYNNRQLMGDERVKNGLTFIYEAPKAYQMEPADPQGKLEWKRDTPMEAESPATPSGSGQDNGGIVRNVRCVRCHQMGHINTDKECPMYEASKEEGSAGGAVDQDQLVEEMRRDGYAFKQNVLGRSIQDETYNKNLVAEDDSDDGPPPEEAFLTSLTKKQKKKLLRKLNRLEKKHSAGSVHKKSCKKRRRHSSSFSEEEQEKQKKTKKHKRTKSSSDDSSSDEKTDGRHHVKQSRGIRNSGSSESNEYKRKSRGREGDERAKEMQEDRKHEKHRDHKQPFKQERRSYSSDEEAGYKGEQGGRKTNQDRHGKGREDDRSARRSDNQVGVKKEPGKCYSSDDDDVRHKDREDKRRQRPSVRRHDSSSDSSSESSSEPISTTHHKDRHYKNRQDISDDEPRKPKHVKQDSNRIRIDPKMTTMPTEAHHTEAMTPETEMHQESKLRKEGGMTGETRTEKDAVTETNTTGRTVEETDIERDAVIENKVIEGTGTRVTEMETGTEKERRCYCEQSKVPVG